MFKKDLSIKIISLLFAIGLWFYIIQVQSPDIERTVKNVPVLFAGQTELEERNLMLVNDKEYTVDLKLRGQRKVLQDLDSTQVSVSADVGGLLSTGDHKVHTRVAVPYGSVEVVNQSPSVVSVTVDEIIEAEKELRVKTTGEPAHGYAVGNTKIEPATMKIRGAKSLVGAIDHLFVTVDVSGKSESISAIAPVELASSSDAVIVSPYVTTEQQNVDVHCEILKKKTVSIEPVFAPGTNNAEQWYALDDSSVKVIEVAGTAAMVDKLEKIQTEEIKPEMLGEDGEVEIKLVLPAGIESLDGDKVTLKLKKMNQK